MNLNDISTQLLFSTVPIWAEKNGAGVTGSAFIYNAPFPGATTGQAAPVLITNSHVVKGASKVIAEFTRAEGSFPSKSGRLTVELNVADIARFSNETLDLFAYPLGPLLNQQEKALQPLFIRSFGPELIPNVAVRDDFSALEEVIFIGYPAGLRDTKNSLPLIRTGRTSTPVWNDFQGERTFLIDANVFPGSSGSPVFILNHGSYTTRDGLAIGTRLFFLGVLSESILKSVTSEVYLNLGKVIRSDVVADFVEQIMSVFLAPVPNFSHNTHVPRFGL